MLDCWLWDVVDCMRHEEDKIAGNTRDRADGVGSHRADIAQEAQVVVAALQAPAQGEGCLGMNTTYTVKHIQKGLTLFVKS